MIKGNFFQDYDDILEFVGLKRNVYLVVLQTQLIKKCSYKRMN